MKSWPKVSDHKDCQAMKAFLKKLSWFIFASSTNPWKVFLPSKSAAKLLPESKNCLNNSDLGYLYGLSLNTAFVGSGTNVDMYPAYSTMTGVHVTWTGQLRSDSQFFDHKELLIRLLPTKMNIRSHTKGRNHCNTVRSIQSLFDVHPLRHKKLQGPSIASPWSTSSCLRLGPVPKLTAWPWNRHHGTPNPCHPLESHRIDCRNLGGWRDPEVYMDGLWQKGKFEGQRFDNWNLHEMIAGTAIMNSLYKAMFRMWSVPRPPCCL